MNKDIQIKENQECGITLLQVVEQLIFEFLLKCSLNDLQQSNLQLMLRCPSVAIWISIKTYLDF